MYLLLSALACAPTETATPPDKTTGNCDFHLEDSPPPASPEQLSELLDLARASAHPDLGEVAVDLDVMESDSDYFVANLDLSTFASPPEERRYLVFYNSLLFDDPPSYAAIGAILVHELKHVADYTQMDAEELAEFAVWYAQGDIAEYERETDEYALQVGCGPGLIEYREWLYARIDDETRAEKERDYYTPDEIEAWMSANR